jgi:hypothetical protein
MRILPPASLAAFAAFALAAPASAAVRVTVNIENLSPTNSISFAPLRLAFNSGIFDSFDVGEAATAPIISIAEGGSGSDWFPAFAAADPTAVLGTVGDALTPGSTASASFIVDPTVNPFFTFGSMVVPSNDFFIGNDNPQAFRLFDDMGNLAITSIGQQASDIWNAGSEIFDPAAAAFLVVGNNDLRTPENGVVEFNFAELAGFDGLTTAAGYVFASGLTADTDIYRISFSTAAIPEPATWAMMILGFGVTGALIRRRRTSPAAPAFASRP